MKFVKSKYRKKGLILVLLSFGMILTNLSLPLFNSLFLGNNYEEDNIIEFDDQYMEPKTAEYQSYDDSGENLNITLHQSVIKEGNPLFEIINASDYDNNTFNIISPNENIFNSTLSEISIEDIFAPNKSLVIEEIQVSSEDFTSTRPMVSSFKVEGDGYLENISCYLWEIGGAPNTGRFKAVLYNASWDSGNSIYKPGGTKDDYTVLGSKNVTGGTFNWIDITGLHVKLDNSKTQNNTWFIGLWDNNTYGGDLDWYYNLDTGHPQANGDQTTSLKWDGNDWVLVQDVGNNVDLNLKVDLAPENNTPLPTDITLKINGTPVSDNVAGSGICKQYYDYEVLPSELEYQLTAEWWDVSCNITQIQVNYTTTNLVASSEFKIAGSGQLVEWNVTRGGGLNYFDSRFENFQINFTIPDTWDEDTIKVFNGSTPKTLDSTNRSLGNGYREVNVLNAGNGTFWHLTASSSNLFSSIDTFVSGIARSMVNHSNIVRFNTTFSEMIYDGILNLSVFTPSQGYLNHTKIVDLTPMGSDTNFTVSDWDVSVNVTEYGVFRIQMSWNNDTAAGFLEDTVTVIADTSLTLNPFPLKYTFDSGETFNLTVFYEDTGLSTGIEADSITYRIGTGSSRPADSFYVGGGYYNITIDANDADFNYGPNTIVVNVEKTYYNNQTSSETITILAETDAYIVYPAMNDVFDSGDTIDLELYYNDTVQDTGITGATIEYSLGGAPFRSDAAITDFANGYYNISISASDANFSGYGFKTIDVNINMDYHYNHSESITIKLLGETTPITAARVPDKAYYTAAETFNISLYYEDSVKNIGVSGATIVLDIGGTTHNPFSMFDYGDGNYEITIDCSDSDFDSYGYFPIRVNVNLTNYYNQTDTLNTLIVGNESLTVLAPNSGAVYIEGQSFDITVEYIDTILSSGIDVAHIEYSLDGGSTFWDTPSKITSLGSGLYNITVEVSDGNFTEYGFVDVIIDVSKQFYENRSTTYTFHRQITTQITPENSIDLGTVIKGLNVSYTFNYSDTTGKPISQAIWSPIGASYGFDAFLQNRGDGNYTMHLDSTNVGVFGSPYTIFFNISSTGNETQLIQMTIDVLIIQTEVINVSSIYEIVRYSGLNQSARFYFNDTTNNLPVLNIATENIVVKNYATGTPFSDGEYWLFDPYGNGTYILDITMGTRNSGWYTLEINASKFPNYDYSLFNVTFYYRGNYTQLNLISYSDVGVLTPTGSGYNFTIFEGSDTTIVLNLTDSENSDNIVLGVANSYAATYLNLISSSNGALPNLFQFTSPNHVGTLTTSLAALIPGRYLINITISKTNYEDASFSFNLTVISKYQANLTVLFKPIEVNTGELFTIVVQAEIFNGISWVPLQNAEIRMTPIFDGVPSLGVQTKSTNSTGQLFFEITTATATTMNITLELLVEYDHLGDSMVISEIVVIPPPPNGFSLDELLPFIIIIGAALVAVGGSVGVYRGVIVPKKREKQRILTEVKTIFDDAINLEHILVLYKGTGTCIFFKSYGSEQIDPELIGGFLTAVSSFGKEMATQEALNEISYGDKMLLLADGNLIRVALVLGKNASLILRRHLKTFITTFEKTYSDVLPDWRGQLNYFRNAGPIVDDLLNTSIILPHQISFNFSNIKDLKDPHSKEVLKIAQSCCEEAEREFFFIATLLKEVADRTNKDTAEIFMGIKELRDKKILIPIEISAIGEQPVSQQEINLINQKVMSLTNLTNEEKQKLVDDLAQLGPVEREAYLSSLTGQQEIVSAPIKTTIGDLSVDNQKAAKKGIKELLKRAKIAQDKKNYLKAVEIYQSAALLASNWELTTELLKIQETIRKTRIEDLKIKKANLEKEAKSAVKEKKYLEAATKYKYASKMASEIFKLGVTDMTKEVKRLTNRANEYEKMK